MNENNPSDVRASNWTLATGTRAGERHVHPRVRQDSPPPPGPNDSAVRRTANDSFVNGAISIFER